MGEFNRWGVRAVFVAGGLLLAGASFLPETLLSAICGFCFALALSWGNRRSITPVRDFCLSGFVFTAVSFYWLPDTIILFGGFGLFLAYVLFIFFCFISALQFAFCAWMAGHLRCAMSDRFFLALPLAWLSAEVIVPRMFPWALGHSLAAIPSLSGVAEYGGVFPLGMLIFWCAEAALSFAAPLLYCAPHLRMGRLAAATALFVCIGCGLLRESSVTRDLAAAPGIRAGIVQGNLSTKEKGDVRYLDVNLERYRSVSAQVIAEGAEVLFWPESVMNQWTPEDLPNVRGTKADPFPAAAVPLVYGGLAYRLKPEMHGELAESHAAAQRKRHFSFNTAFGLDEHGNVTGVYHKQVLMPFGEYMPFADIFPALRALSPHTGDFTPGDRKAPIVLQVKRAAQNSAPVSLRAGALICYEDLVPSLSREAVAHGANILVNLTNDAWYGKTAAPYQHNLLAQWRAIETRRYLLRVTNTGLTAVIDPLGRTVQQLPLFSEGYLISDVRLLNAVTVYSKVGDLPVWVISAISLLYCFRRRKA